MLGRKLWLDKRSNDTIQLVGQQRGTLLKRLKWLPTQKDHSSLFCRFTLAEVLSVQIFQQLQLPSSVNAASVQMFQQLQLPSSVMQFQFRLNTLLTEEGAHRCRNV